MWRFKWPCRLCRSWIEESAWWDWVWQAEPDVEGDRTLEYALAFYLLLGNICSKEHDSHLITYKSGKVATQIDFIFVHKTMRKLVTDVKMIPGKEVALQHQLLVCDMRIGPSASSSLALQFGSLNTITSNYF